MVTNLDMRTRHSSPTRNLLMFQDLKGAISRSHDILPPHHENHDARSRGGISWDIGISTAANNTL